MPFRLVTHVHSTQHIHIALHQQQHQQTSLRWAQTQKNLNNVLSIVRYLTRIFYQCCPIADCWLFTASNKRHYPYMYMNVIAENKFFSCSFLFLSRSLFSLLPIHPPVKFIIMAFSAHRIGFMYINGVNCSVSNAENWICRKMWKHLHSGYSLVFWSDAMEISIDRALVIHVYLYV